MTAAFESRGAFGTETLTEHRGSSVSWEGFRVYVEQTLARFFGQQQERAASKSPAFATLWEQMATSTGGGKWLRPRLVHLSYTAFGGTDWRACAELAAAFEMLHAALLVHDDVIDRDFVRRGQGTLGAHYRDQAAAAGHSVADANHAGFSAAIIAGDLLLTGSLRLAGTAAAGHPHAGAIMATMHEAIFASAAGELDDLLFSLSTAAPELAAVLNMERMKTAVYSFEMPLRAGALLAGQSVADADALAAVGRDIGVAYQVIDDVLGTFGQADETGKSVESDLREGKRTILTTFADTAGDFPAVVAAFQRGEVDAATVRAALRELGAEHHAVELAHSLVSAALAQAERLTLPPSLVDELENICNYVLSRRS